MRQPRLRTVLFDWDGTLLDSYHADSQAYLHMFRVLGISCVTNMAAGTTDAPLNHEEVLRATQRIKGQFISLLRAVIPRIAEAIA